MLRANTLDALVKRAGAAMNVSAANGLCANELVFHEEWISQFIGKVEFISDSQGE